GSGTAGSPASPPRSAWAARSPPTRWSSPTRRAVGSARPASPASCATGPREADPGGRHTVPVVDTPFPGVGTLVNVVAVLLGAGLGLTLGHRLGEHTRAVVTDCLGLVTLLVAGLSAASVTSAALTREVGDGVPVLIVLGSLLIGGITGSV